MRRIVTGVGPDGRSTVLSSGPPEAFFVVGPSDIPDGDLHSIRVSRSTPRTGLGPAESSTAEAWLASASVAADAAGVDLTGDMQTFDLHVPSGQLRWRITELGPNFDGVLHATTTLDLDLVVSGEVDLLLEDQDLRLRAGDCVVIPGVVHGWRTGATGCTLSVVMLGLAPSGGGSA